MKLKMRKKIIPLFPTSNRLQRVSIQQGIIMVILAAKHNEGKYSPINLIIRILKISPIKIGNNNYLPLLSRIVKI